MKEDEAKQVLTILDWAIKELCEKIGLPHSAMVSQFYKPKTTEDLVWVLTWLALHNIFMAGATIAERDKREFELDYAENGYAAKFLRQISPILFPEGSPDFATKFETENWPPNPIFFKMTFKDEKKS